MDEKIIKYKKLWKLITQPTIYDKINEIKLYNLIVDEYEDMEDNPNKATIRDVEEIADASSIEIIIEE